MARARELTLADVIGEQALLLGAGSAVMYQLAMKGVGLGVAEHSSALRRPIDRLRTTLTYVYIMTLGTEAERKELARLVNKAHVPIRSEGRYTAFDPDLQMWVAATLIQNSWIHEKIFGEYDDATRERIYQEGQVFGNALQVKPDMWPADWAAFQAYWEKTVSTDLQPDPAVQAYARALLSTKGVAWTAKPLIPLQSLMTRGNLDPRVREVLALPWSARDQKRYDIFWKWFVPVYRRVPKRLRDLHAHLIVRDFRRRLAKGGHII